MNKKESRFTPRPRNVNSEAAVRRLENLAAMLTQLQTVSDRLQAVTPSMLEDSLSDEAMIAEYLVIRVDTYLRRLPAEIEERLDAADIRGLRDSRNVIAHDYFSVIPAMLHHTVTRKIPALLATIEEELASALATARRESPKTEDGR